MRKILITGFILSFFIASSAFAQTFTPEGAENIKAEIDKWLELQVKLMEMSSYDEETEIRTFNPVTLEGDTTVSAADGYYEAKLPFITFAMSDERRIEIGQIAINIVPEDDNPALWNMTMAMPKNMPVINQVGQSVGAINIGGQRFKGRLDTDRDIFLQYEMAYQDIQGEETDNGIKSMLKIKSLNAQQDLRSMVDNPDLYNGPITFEATGIEGSQGGKDGIKVSIAKIDGATVYAQIPLFNAEEFQNKILQYNDNTSEMAEHDLIKTIFETFAFLPDNAKSHFSMHDVYVISDDEDGETGMSAELVNFGSFGSGLKSDDANIGMGYEISGLAFTNMAAEYAPYLPYLSQLNAEVTNLPLVSALDLIKIGTTGALDTSQDLTDEQRTKMMESTFSMIAPLFAKHATTITIKDTRTVAPEFALTLAGDVKASGASPRGFVGEIVMQVKGFDKAVSALRETMQKNEESRLFLQQVVMGLTMAQSIGQLDDTQTTRIYRFEFKETGDIFVNGTNFGGFMGSMAH